MGNTTSIEGLAGSAEASTSWRIDAAADSSAIGHCSIPFSSMNMPTLPDGDGAAVIMLQQPPDPDKTSQTMHPGKAALATLLSPPPGYVRLTAEERAAAVAAGKAAREAERRELEARMAAADAKAQAAAAQGAGSFFGDMAGLGEGEELGGSMEDEEDGGCLLEEEEEEGIELDGADDATFGDMEDWEPPAEDAVAAGRAAYLQQRAQQKAAVALFNAQVAAHAAAQAQQ